MIEITWLGHATFAFRFEAGEVLVMDPWIEGNPKYPKGYELKRVDAIAISHGHSDHTNDVIPLARKFEPKVLAIFEIAAALGNKGVKNTMGANKGGTVDLGFVKMTMTHAIHSSSLQDGDEILYGGEPAGYVLTLPDGRAVYFAGDTALFSDMVLIRELYHPELAMLPIGDYYTMGPLEACHATRFLNPKRVIPMHYGTFPELTGRPEDLQARLDGEGIHVWTLTPGVPVEW